MPLPLASEEGDCSKTMAALNTQCNMSRSRCFRWGELIQIFGLLVVLMIGCHAPGHAAELTVTDGLTSPGKPISLQARLTDRNAEGESGLPGRDLEFYVHGRAVGQAKTDAQGWARLEFSPTMRGNLAIIVKVVTPAKAERVEGKGVLLSWERRRPILLIDLAVLTAGELIPDTLPPEPSQDPGLILGEAHPAAAAELDKLSQFYYNLVYLDLTGRGTLEHIQTWLREHAFPPGMIRILPPTPTALTHLLETLKAEGWEKVSGGIGSTVDFAKALVQHRLQAIILPFSTIHRDQFPRRAIILNDWSRVRRHL